MTEAETPNHSAEEWLNEKLPAELQQQIYDNLEVSDKLALRAVLPKAQQDFIEHALRGTVDTLYVCPSKNSLNNFKNICGTAYYQQHVTHVIFVPRAVGEAGFEPIRSFKQYREQVPTLGIEDARQSFCIYCDLVTDSEIAVSPAEHEQGPIESVAKLLRRGMRKLPNLSAVSVITTISKDGLNANPLWYSQIFASSKDALGHYNMEQDVTTRAAVKALGCHISSDHGIDTFFDALSVPNLSLQSLTLGEGMVAQLWSQIQVCTHFNLKTVKSVFSKVKKLSVDCMDLDADDLDDGTNHMWKHIAKSAVKLEELHLYDGVVRGKVTVLDHFIRFGCFSKLEKLRIFGDHITPGILDAMHFKRFLNEHRDIRSVVVQDMLLCHRYEKTCKAMKDVFDHARSKMSKDAVFSMKVRRRDEHNDVLCSHPLFEDVPPCEGTCEMYIIDGRKWLQRSELDELAEELEVEVVDGSWDFGAYVMRA